MKVLAEGLVLDEVPADSDTEPQATAGEEIDIGRLSCHERRLALGKDQDPGGETDALGYGRRDSANITNGSWNGSCSV